MEGASIHSSTHVHRCTIYELHVTGSNDDTYFNQLSFVVLLNPFFASLGKGVPNCLLPTARLSSV